LTNLQQHTVWIKQIAFDCGFDYCGIAKAERLDEDARRLEAWLNKGFHGKMQYMEKYFDLRIDPAQLVPGAKSVITLMKNYYPEAHQKKDTPKISKYAYGKDYHEVIKEKLTVFLERIKEKLGNIQGRGFVDSAPVLERTWALRSGLGWIGKNGMLINKNAGSFFFIAVLIVDAELLYDAPYIKDFCGTCTKCIDACPTNAILPGKILDAGKCISYFTIELKDLLLPEEMKGKFDGWIFGCDVCQDVCPWNSFSKAHHEEAFRPVPEILDLTVNEWEEMTEENFKKMFKHSPLKRTKYLGIQRNLKFVYSG
jgi:epoxyqueuosine reductase